MSDAAPLSRSPAAGTTTPGGPLAGLPLTRPSDGTTVLARSASDALEERFLGLLFAARWALLIVGVTIAVTRDDRDTAMLAAGGLLAAWTVALTFRPHRVDERDGVWWAIVGIDVAIALFVVAATNGEQSPYLLSVLVPLALASFTAGRREVLGLLVAGAGALAATLVASLSSLDPGSSTLLAMLYLSGGVIGSLARRGVDEMRERETATLREVERLSAANELLQALHAVAQTLPTSLDLDDVVGSIRDQVRDHLRPHALALVVRDEATRGWRTELADGVRLPEVMSTAALPPALTATVGGDRVAVVHDSLAERRVGVSPFTRSALYVPLVARGDVIGILAIEHSDARRYSDDDARWVGELAGPLALALDNARWFRRLRRFGAETERARIARELHDRLAQSLAYVGFELERLAAMPAPDPAAIAELQGVVRQIVSELRDTLSELRAGVTEALSLTDAARELCRRVQERSGIVVTFTASGDRRLPLPVEQEMWLILQEAVLNAERHSGTDHITVTWTISPDAARLEVGDTGRGFVDGARQADRFGLVGMRERADAIGADLSVESRPHDGTRVVVHLALEPEPA